ncbi:MAG: T9SS type A sorting domain-containing protein [Bacteroidetes bacterium]|nr:T9SS type A sorting domain-containing protein [Bacteroidota bacterium]
MKKVSVLAMLLMVFIQANSQSAKWSHRVITTSRCGSTNGHDVVFDNLGNTFGLFNVTNPINNPVGCLDQNDLAVIKYNSSGNQTAYFEYDLDGLTSNDYPVTLKRESNGNIYTVANNGPWTYLLKLNSALVLQWEARFYGITGVDLVIANSGAFVIANNAAGAVILKYRKTDGLLLDYDINIDAQVSEARTSGSAIAITGYKNTATNAKACFTALYDTTVALQWEKLHNGQNGATDDFGVQVQLINNNVYTLAKSFQSASGNDYVVIKYDLAGTQLFNRRFKNSGMADDSPVDMEIDAVNNNIYFGGNTSISNNWIFYRLNSNGTQRWKKTFNTNAGVMNQIMAITINATTTDSATKVFACGSYDVNSPDWGSGARYFVLGLNANNGTTALIDTTNFFESNSSLNLSEVKVNSSVSPKELVVIGGGYPHPGFAVDDKEIYIKCYTNASLLNQDTRTMNEQEAAFQIVPNPALDYFVIDGLNEDVPITVYDAKGSIVEKLVYDGNALNCSTWLKGIYTLEFTINSKPERVKVIK